MLLIFLYLSLKSPSHTNRDRMHRHTNDSQCVLMHLYTHMYTHIHTHTPFKVHVKLALASDFQLYPVSSSDDCLNKGNVRLSLPVLFGFFKHLSSVKLISAAKKGSLSGIKAADLQDSEDSPAKCTQAHSLR